MNWELTFQLLAVMFGAIAAFFFWQEQTEVMFVAGVLGAVAFFLSIRMQVRTRVARRVSENEIHSSTDADVN